MSIENLQKFMKHVSADADAVLKLKDCHAKGNDAVAAYAKELGFDVDGSDIELLNSQIAKTAKAILDAEKADESEGMKNLKNFIKLSEGSEEIKNKLTGMGFDNPQAIIAYGKELGFEFTEKDLDELGKQLLGKSDELSDEDLEKIAGGMCTATLGLLGLVIAAGGFLAVALIGAVGGMSAVAVGGLLVGFASASSD